MEMTRNALRAKVAVYSLHMNFAGKWELIYISVAKPWDFTLLDLIANPLFQSVVPMDAELRPQILSLHATYEDAKNAATALIEAHKPYCNGVEGGNVPINSKRVRCITDDMKEFENANQAAEHYRIDPGALYKHLKGKPRFNSVGGHRFERF